MTALLFLVLSISCPLLSHAQNCLQWIKRTDVGSYGQRWLHAMAYDSDRGVTVFFGGEIGKEGEVTYFNDTQEYDGKQWKQISTAVKPPARSGHAMAYDPVRKKVVMFGGSGSESTSDSPFNDTWVYSGDGVNGFWELQQPETKPPGVAWHAMVWDSSNQVVLLYASYWGSTWTWNGTNWLNNLSDGPALWHFGMAFDSGRATAMIAGGNYQIGGPINTIREKGPNTGWVDRGPGPSARNELAMAYDERRKRVVMVGGAGESVETGETAYEYNHGTGWFILPSLPSGQGRAGARMVYDSKRSVMVLTGGAGGGAPNAENGGRYSDTWELWPSLFVSGQPSDVTNLVCGTATFSTFVQGVAPFQYQWRLDGAPLTDDAHVFGSRTAELQINGLRQTHTGKYDVVVRDNCNPQNVVTSKVATLTVRPGTEWVLRGTNGPLARFAHEMAYDKARRVTVLFGGLTNWGSRVSLNDLWEWDGARWTQRVANSVSNGWTYAPETGWRVTHTNGPVRRGHFAMAYDSRRGRTVIFGGLALDPGGNIQYLRDLWEWDGTRWHFRATNGPVPRYYGSMAYDERRGRNVLFGGLSVPDAGETADGELVWEWDGQRWHTNQPPLNPSEANNRAQSRMTYDSFRGVVVFGPTTENHSHWAFWDWDGAKWSIFPVVHFTDPIVTVLHGTGSGSLAFDANRRRSTWFGGLQIGPVNHTAFFDGKEWALLTNSTTLPAKRILPAMAYDSDRRVMVMFGGSLEYGGATATNDTWELIAMDLPLINEYPASQYRVAGETATFTANAVSPTFLSYQWYRGNTPIPGATASTFTIPNVQPGDAGEYSVAVANSCGSIRSRPAVLTLNDALQIFSSDHTTTLIWKPDPSVVLESADVVTGPWTVVSDPPNPFTVGGGSEKYFRLQEVE